MSRLDQREACKLAITTYIHECKPTCQTLFLHYFSCQKGLGVSWMAKRKIHTSSGEVFFFYFFPNGSDHTFNPVGTQMIGAFRIIPFNIGNSARR